MDADSELDKLNIILDMRNASVKASKNFSEYIQIMIWGEWGYKDVEVEVQYIESQNSIGLQCADYVANAIYVYYEKDNPSLVECIKPKIRVRQKFPYKKFGC